MSAARPLATLCRIVLASGIALGTLAIPGLPATARAADVPLGSDAILSALGTTLDEASPPPTPQPSPPASDPIASATTAPEITASPSATPTAPPDPAGSPSPPPAPTASPSPSPSPSPSASPDPSASANPSPSGDPSGGPTPTPSDDPTPSASASPDPSPTPTPTPTATPTPTPTVPTSLNLFVASGFRYQDPNYTACAATAAEVMLNFVALAGSGGEGFRWQKTVSSARRDSMLAYARATDTLASSSRGTDPHGWRNALNYYGWGDAAMEAGQMVYQDVRYSSYSDAIHAAVRQMILTRKPVGILGWAGHHAMMLTGYYGLRGNPLARKADGSWSNAFRVAGLYITDPLRSDALVNRRVGYTYLASAPNLKLRFRPYYQTDSPYDDRYTPGYRVARKEWYAGFVVLLPIR